MNRRRLALAGLAGLAGCCHGFAAAQAAPDGKIDWPAIALLDGERLLPASWIGQPAVVVFWETWCPYCKRHNARIDRLYRATRDVPFRVLGVAMENDAGKVRSYMRSHGFVFPVALGNEDLRGRLTRRKVIPLTCTIDRRGRLLQAIPGEMSEEDVLRLAPAS